MLVNAFAAKKRGSKLKAFNYELGELRSDEIDIDVEYCGICIATHTCGETTGVRQYIPLFPVMKS